MIPHYKNGERLALAGRKVRVHRNLNRRCWSVTERGKVIAHVDELWLYAARFIVSQAGRRRVLRDKRKNVHAWVEGTVSKMVSYMPSADVRYNPYKEGAFLLCGRDPIRFAKLAYFSAGGKLSVWEAEQ